MDEQSRNRIQPNNYNLSEEPGRQDGSLVPPVEFQAPAKQPYPQEITSNFTPSSADPTISAMPEPSDPAGQVQDTSTMVSYGNAKKPTDIFLDQKNNKKKKVFIIIGILLLLSGVVAVLFYFLYWIRSDVVYARFQSNMANVITRTSNSETQLTDNVAYTFEGSAENKDIPFAIKGTSRINKGSSDTGIEVAFNKATINLSFMTFSQKNILDSFIKWKGIEQFYNTLKKQQKSSGDWLSLIGPSVKVLKKYDDRWINLDLPSIASGGSGTAPEPITIKEYESLVDVLVPIFNDWYIGLDKNNAVITTTNIKSEDVNGRDCWAYELAFNDAKLNSMIDAMVKAVDTTTLSKNNKKIVKDFLQVYKKPTIPEKTDKRTFVTDSASTTTTKNTVWIDKLTGIPIRGTSTSENTYEGTLSSTSTTVFNISEFSMDKIKASFVNNYRSYTYSYVPRSRYLSTTSKDKPYTESYISVSFVIDNKSTKNSVDITYDPDIKKTKDSFTGTLTLEKPKDNNVISKPANTVPMRQVTDELSASRSRTYKNL